MKFSQALIFIACAPSAMVYAAQYGGQAVAGCSQRSQSFKDRQERQERLINQVVKEVQCGRQEARIILTKFGWEKKGAIQFFNGRRYGNPYKGNVVFTPNKVPHRSGDSDEPTLPSTGRQAAVDKFKDSDRQASLEEIRTYNEKPLRRDSSSKDDQDLSSKDGEVTIIYERDGVMRCAAATCTKLGDILGDSILQQMCAYLTQFIECPFVTIGYMLTYCWVKCWGGIENLKCCGCDDDIRCIEKGFEMESLKFWLKESQEATWYCLGGFTTAICKTSWFCVKNVGMATVSCTARNKILCCPRNTYHALKERYEQGIEKQHEGMCKVDCPNCDKCCERTADCLVCCCCETTGAIVDYFMCCCHALVTSAEGAEFDAEGCQVFCELVSCCAACTGISR